jgi:hypothetical protein
VSANAEGRYTACGVPIDEEIRVIASFLDRKSDEAETSFSKESHQVLDLGIELRAGLLAGRGEVTVRSTEYGAQGIQGVLVERGSSDRIRAAVVTVTNAAGEVVARGETNTDGFFRLTTPTPGRFLLSAQALGYGGIDAVAVDVGLGNLSVLDVRMAPQAVELEPIVVTAGRRAFHLEMQGFYRRQADGFGKFLTPELFEERRPRRVTDLMFGLSGTHVVESSTGIGRRAVYFRSGIRPSGVCWPMVWVDRHLISTGGFAGAGAEPTAIDDLIAAPDVHAVEIFRSPAEIPSEFNGPNAGCGVIVIWTRRGGSG